MSLVKRHPIITFFVLTYVLTWSLESPLVFLTDSITDTQGLILVILASNVPSVMAIVLTAMVFGWGALRKLLGRLLIWRVDPLWYLLLVLGPAALIIGPIWALWHLPLWLTGEPGRTPTLSAGFVVSVIALSVVLTWVYNSTGGSLLFVVLLHATYNLPITLAIDDLGSRATVPVLLYFGLLVVAAIVVVIVAGPKHLSRKHRKQKEEGATESGVATPPGVVKPTPA